MERSKRVFFQLASHFPISAMLALALIAGFGCGLNSSKKEYILAERLWTDGKYRSAVAEFDKVYARDPKSRLGHQALFRAAMTQAYFLSQYEAAIEKFRTYTQVESDLPSVWEAQRQIGELLFSKLEHYNQAAAHYQALLKKSTLPSAEAPFFRYRIARSYFFLGRFDDALKEYQALIEGAPSSSYAEKAAYELGSTYFTRGEQLQEKGGESYQKAMTAYKNFLKNYPKGDLVPQAKFGIASCLEEMDQLDRAYQAYEELKSTYPSPKVIQIKLARIKERQAQRNH